MAAHGVFGRVEECAGLLKRTLRRVQGARGRDLGCPQMPVGFHTASLNAFKNTTNTLPYTSAFTLRDCAVQQPPVTPAKCTERQFTTTYRNNMTHNETPIRRAAGGPARRRHSQAQAEILPCSKCAEPDMGVSLWYDVGPYTCEILNPPQSAFRTSHI